MTASSCTSWTERVGFSWHAAGNTCAVCGLRRSTAGDVRPMISGITETSRRAGSVVDLSPGGCVMDLAPHVRAVEVLMSPLEWGSRDAWLAESLRRVRGACGAAGPYLPAEAVGELEALLHL